MNPTRHVRATNARVIKTLSVEEIPSDWEPDVIKSGSRKVDINVSIDNITRGT
jgi:hypothetical protein